MLTQNTHFSIAVHVLVALAVHADSALPSSTLADSVHTNPAFLRAVLRSLREAGLIDSQRGKGGGFTLGRPAADIDLATLYRVTGGDSSLATHSCGPDSDCALARGVAGLLSDVSQRLDSVVTTELSRTSIADLAARVRVGLEAGPTA